MQQAKANGGAYVAEGGTPYVILFNTPCDPQFATA